MTKRGRRGRRVRADDFESIRSGVGLDASEVDVTQLAVEALLYQADCARTDPRAFFEFVMREEHTRAELVTMPHQRLAFEFLMAHEQCVLRLPVGTSKTYLMTAFTLWLLGQDATSRGAFVSATQTQAMKPLSAVRDIIEESRELQMVFPKLRRSARKADSWNMYEITVDRPPGIRDPSLVAVGIDGAIAGARLSWAVVDDILDRENTATLAGLKKVHDWFDSSVLSRIDPNGGRIVVTNTPWHPEDLTYRLESAGWPTLTMDVLGNVRLNNVPHWDSTEIIPSARPGEVYRLAAHAEPKDSRDEVCEETVPLWPDRYGWEAIDKLKRDHLPQRFNQLYLCICRDDKSARCKTEWVDACKELGKGSTLVAQYMGVNPTFTGVDLAVGKGAAYDQTAFFTFEQLADGKRRVLDVEFGQYDAPVIVEMLIDKARRFSSVVRVENNAAQSFLLQFARARNASIPLRAHTTGRNKVHPEFGVESLFIELQNAAWIIPCDSTGRCHATVQRWIDECLYYQPGQHVGDVLMAAWFAREQAREFGMSAGVPTMQGVSRAAGIATGLLMR